MNARIKLLLVSLSFLAALTIARAQNHPAPPRHITLQEAVQLALKHNHLVRITALQVEEKQHAKDVARSAYFPTVRNESRVFNVTDSQFIELPAGSLGTAAGTPIPERSVILNQGGKTFVTSGTGLVQPLTQLFTKVKPANDAARADLNAARASARETENEVALKVHQLYYRVLIAQLHRSATEARIKAAQDLQSERIQQVKFGSTLDEELIESRAQSLQAKQELLSTELQLSDVTLQLDDVIGLPLTTALDLDPGVSEVKDTCEREECVKVALQSHPEIVAAREELRKASAGVQLSKAEYVPDVVAFARYSYQNNVPFLARNFGTFGVQLTYDLFDGGRRRAALHESDAKVAQAKENLARVSDEVELRLQVAYNKLQRTREMVKVSEELLALRAESSRVSAQQLEKGSALKSQADNALAQEFDARTLLLQSQLDYIQSRDEITLAMGLTPE
jgi:outer membrane protein TolC